MAMLPGGIGLVVRAASAGHGFLLSYAQSKAKHVLWLHSFLFDTRRLSFDDIGWNFQE